MATRLYPFPNDAPAQSPGFETYTSTADARRRKLLTAAAGGKPATTEQWTGALTSGANNTALMVQAISEPLDVAQTISGTYTIVLRARELAAQDNINSRHVSIRVFTSAGALRGTLRASAQAGSNTGEWVASLGGVLFALNGALTSVACQPGDVIVVECAARMSGTGTSPQWELLIGGDGADMTAADGAQANPVGWVEFSQNLTFAIAPQDIALATASASVTAPPLESLHSFPIFDDFTGTNGDPPDTAKWDRVLEGTTTIEQQDGQLRFVSGVQEGALYARGGPFGDQEVIGLIEAGADNVSLWLVLRSSGSGAPPASCYLIEVTGSGQFLYRSVGGSGTFLAGAAGGSGMTPGERRKFRYQAFGTGGTVTLRFRQWADDGSAEPSTWAIDHADTDAARLLSGVPGVIILDNGVYELDFIGINPTAQTFPSGAQTIALAAASAALSAPPLSLAAGPVDIALSPAQAVLGAPALTLAVGPVDIALAPATVTATAQPISVANALASLVEDFDAGSIDTGKWEIDGSNVTQSGGMGRLNPQAAGAYERLRSLEAFRVAGSSAFARFVMPATATNSRQAGFEIVDAAPGNGFSVGQFGANLGFIRYDGGSQQDSSFNTYDPVAHAWLRIRADSTTLYLDTSPDGVSWSQWGSTTPPWSLQTPVKLTFFAGWWDAGEADPGQLAVDNLNVAPAGAQTIALAAAGAVLSAPALSLAVGPVAIALGVPTGVLGAPPLSLTVGPVSIALASAGAAFAARPLALTVGPISVQLAAASSSFAAPPLSLTVGGQQIALGIPTAVVAARPLTLTPGPISLALAAAGAVYAAPPIALQVGGQVVLLAPASAALAARPLALTVGPISLPLAVASAAFQAPPLSLTPGPIVVQLAAASAAFQARPLTVTALAGPQEIALAAAVAALAARPLGLSVGPVVLALSPATAVFAARALDFPELVVIVEVDLRTGLLGEVDLRVGQSMIEPSITVTAREAGE